MSTVRQRHRATVKDNRDPQMRGRLKVASASLMGVDGNGEAIDYPNWIEPNFPVLFSADGDRANGGWFAIPSVGVTVDIELSTDSTFDQSVGQTEQTDPDPRWRTALLRSGDTMPPEFKTNYPQRFGYKSASGHLMIFDDANDLTGGDIAITHRAGMQVKLAKSGISIGLSPAGPELLGLFNQLLTALDIFTTATSAAVIEPTLGASAATLKAQIATIKVLLGQIKA